MAQPPYLPFAIGVLYRLLSHFEYQIDALPHTSDIECLHQARVAVRRLRMAFWLFDDILMPDSRAWRQPIIRMGRFLAKNRDLDVQMAALREFIDRAPPEAHLGLVGLLTVMARDRRRCQKQMLVELERFEKKGWSLKARRSLYQSLKRHRTAQSVETMSPVIVKMVQTVIDDGKDLSLMDVTTLHELRKTIRYLRYGVEIFNSFYDNEPVRKALKPLKRLQEILGDIHDCDVWLEVLPIYRDRLQEDEQAYLPSMAAGIDWLVADRASAREALFQTLCAQWEKLDEKAFWTKLTDRVTTCDETDPPSEPSEDTPPPSG